MLIWTNVQKYPNLYFAIIRTHQQKYLNLNKNCGNALVIGEGFSKILINRYAYRDT